MRRLTYRMCERAVLAGGGKLAVQHMPFGSEDMLAAYAASTGRRLPLGVEAHVVKNRFYRRLPLSDVEKVALGELQKDGWKGSPEVDFRAVG